MSGLPAAILVLLKVSPWLILLWEQRRELLEHSQTFPPLVPGLVPGAVEECMSSAAFYDRIHSKKGTWGSCLLQLGDSTAPIVEVSYFGKAQEQDPYMLLILLSCIYAFVASAFLKIAYVILTLPWPLSFSLISEIMKLREYK